MPAESLNETEPGKARPGRQWSLDATQLLSVASRALPVAIGPITVYLIGTRLTRELQGYYFTFTSLAALQILVELGLSLVLVSVVSHEWAHLELHPDGSVTGDPRALARLAGLGRFAFRWYAGASVALVAVLAIAGTTFLSTGSMPRSVWHGPWIALCAVTGLQLFTVPYLAILEGCNQVRTVYALRTTQAVVNALALWTSLAAGAQLWALPLSVGAAAVTTLFVLAASRRRFWTMFRGPGRPGSFTWREDVFPLQWRMALQGLVNYFAFQLFSPALFYSRGSVVAGQMGMTLTLLNAVARVGYSTFEPMVPVFGSLIARRDFKELDRRYARAVRMSVSLVALGVLAVLGAVALLGVLRSPFRQRLLDLPSAGLLALATMFLNLSQCRSALVRAHKRDPQVFMVVTSSLLIGAGVWFFAWRWGAVGAAAAYLGVQAFYITPLQAAIFRRARREYRN